MTDSKNEEMAQLYEFEIDRTRWDQVREICRREAGREVEDADCVMMIVESYLERRGLL